jgi:drug/metabolite transporter (DMT)-like permease
MIIKSDQLKFKRLKMKNGFFFALRNYKAALVAALFFGCVAPGTKFFIKNLPPQSMAGVLYFFAGAGLFIILGLKGEIQSSISQFQKEDSRWIFAAIFFGGILGPAFLTYGLLNISASTASLLLNFESVLTSLIAWTVFKEHFEKRIVWGMLFIILGGLILSWSSHGSNGSDRLLGFVLISLACLSWGIDNNVTRNISHRNPIFTASLKGLVAGSANLVLGMAIGEKLSFNTDLILVGTIGFLGIGVSLVAFIVSLKDIGTARTGALFSTAPFVGSILSILVLKDPVSTSFIVALFLMACGVWLHFSEVHSHEHTHTDIEHCHEHTHDEHHLHHHESNNSQQGSHIHLHRHKNMTHNHPHFPDIHHQHSHKDI